MPRPQPVALLAASPLWDGLSGGTLVVACSGGRDSVALACAAHELINDADFLTRFKTPPQLCLWHMDHGLREDSSRDAEFVRQLAVKLGVQSEIERAELGAELAANGGNAEELARERRYAALGRLLAGAGAKGPVKAPALAVTAHHRGDQAETILFNLVRGTHLTGLRGIAPVRDGLVHRPWLELEPDTIDAYLEQLGQDYLDDPTNVDTTFSRNLLRHEVMPRLKQVNPAALKHIARLADTSRTALSYIQRELRRLPVEEYSEHEADRWLPLIGWPRGDYEIYRLDDGWLNVELLAQFAAGRLRKQLGALSTPEYNSIMGWALEPERSVCVRGSWLNMPHQTVFTIMTVDSEEVEQASVRLDAGEAHNIGGLRVGISRAGREEWRRRRTGTRQPWEVIRHWGEALVLLIDSPPRRPGWYCFLPADVALPLTLRAWREGDRLELPTGGTKKAGDVFTDAKVPLCFRPVWTVLADANGEVLWMPGLADSRAMQLADGSDPAWVVSLTESG